MKTNEKETKFSRRISVGVLGMVMLAGATLSVPVLAGTASNLMFRASCHEVSSDIHQLMHANPDSLCVGDLDVAAAYVDAAEMMLERDKVWQALMDIEQARYELYDISVNRPHCASLASGVKRVLAKLIRAKGEIEANEPLKIMHQ